MQTAFMQSVSGMINCHSCIQALLKEVESTPNVVKATNRKRLYEELEDIQKRLAVCEKALAEYLETKRLAFPRFYFISSSDLLDILSKGNIPVEVCICAYCTLCCTHWY